MSYCLPGSIIVETLDTDSMTATTPEILFQKPGERLVVETVTTITYKKACRPVMMRQGLGWSGRLGVYRGVSHNHPGT